MTRMRQELFAETLRENAKEMYRIVTSGNQGLVKSRIEAASIGCNTLRLICDNFNYVFGYISHRSDLLSYTEHRLLAMKRAAEFADSNLIIFVNGGEPSEYASYLTELLKSTIVNPDRFSDAIKLELPPEDESEPDLSRMLSAEETFLQSMLIYKSKAILLRLRDLTCDHKNRLDLVDLGVRTDLPRATEKLALKAISGVVLVVTAIHSSDTFLTQSTLILASAILNDVYQEIFRPKPK
jgi:hypothetical protein